MSADAARPILVSGATGLVGGRLVAALGERGERIRALSRRGGGGGPARVDPRVWDGVTAPREALAGARAVVHLSGEPIFGGLPTAVRRARMRASRIDSTRELARAIDSLPDALRPAVFVCASAVGFYGSRGEEVLAETATRGNGFLADLCVDWEAPVRAVASARSVSLRIGIVLAREGGALPMMARPFRFGVGGRLGDGRQWVPWIHIDDLVSLILTALDDDRYSGPINAVAPNPVRNAELTAAIAEVLRRPALLPVPAFAIRGVLGALSGELLDSKRVVPERAAKLGFAYAHPEIESALERELGH